MKTYLDTLRPSEKRLVVGIGLIFFVVLNFWFVLPHFDDWNNRQIDIKKAQEKLRLYQEEIQQAKRYEVDIKRMEGDGYSVPAEDQAMHFQTAVQTMAAQAGIGFQSVGRVSQGTNQFFLKLSEPVTLTAKEDALINFLYNLGSGASLIRVRDLAIRPDAPRQNLSATIKLEASYQKKVPVRAGAGSSPSSSTPSKRP
jgi:type II secretory pathway component PulM